MREVGKTLGIPVHVFGNETHMTAIVSMALGKRQIPTEPTGESHTANFLLPGGQNAAVSQNLGWYPLSYFWRFHWTLMVDNVTIMFFSVLY